MDDELDDDNMAAIMGFSSFSEMPKPKRQKVDDSSSNSLSSNPNKTPLGKRNPRELQASEPELNSGPGNLLSGHVTSNRADETSLPLGRPLAKEDNSADPSASTDANHNSNG